MAGAWQDGLVGEGVRVARIDDVQPLEVAGVHWHPMRHTLGIRSFGMNAYSGGIGDQVVEEHTEDTYGHLEAYVVVRGHATFTVQGEELDAPAGTVIYLDDPSLRRSAVAAQDDTLVLAIGAPVGKPYEPSSWEFAFRAAPLARAGRMDEALALMHEGLAQHPGDANVLYNLACYEALAGRPDDALEHLDAAVAADPRAREWARDDADFASIRDDARFPA
jgi:Tetratricopeptide repeat